MPDIVRIRRIGGLPGLISEGDGLRRTRICTALAIQAEAGHPEGAWLVVFDQLKIGVDLADANARSVLWCYDLRRCARLRPGRRQWHRGH